MGCVVASGEQFEIKQEIPEMRSDRKTQKVDCRRKSTKTCDRIVQNIIIQQKTENSLNEEFIRNILQNHELFYSLEYDQISQVIENMQMASTPNDQYIFHQNQSGTCFFIIEEGEVNIQIDGKYKKTLHKGDSFGQLALLFLTKRSASVKCKCKNLKLLFLNSNVFKKVMAKTNEKKIEVANKIFQKIQIFFCLNTKQKYSLINCFKRKRYNEGACVFKKGEESKDFYVIETGKVSLTFNNPSKKDIIIGEYQSFGQSAFRKSAVRQGTATAYSNLTCFYIDKQSMEKCLGNKLTSIIHQNIKKWTLKSSLTFCNYSSSQLEIIASEFKNKSYKADQLIIGKGKQIKSILINLEGKMNGQGQGTIFFDQYLNLQKVVCDGEVFKNDDGVIAELSYEKARKIISKIEKQTIKEEEEKENISTTNSRKSSIKKSNIFLNLRDFEYLRKLGEGQFGQVYLVKDRKLGSLYALKSINKNDIVKQGMQDSVISERKILSMINHPLIVGYHKSYHDKKYVYLLLQYLNGIQMYYAIREIGILNKTISRFYFGSILAAIEYLHSLNIIYRDAKPQNCIVDSQGRVFLIDLGTAKVLSKQQGYRTQTIIGTPHYLAPEVMQGKGYSFEVDLWSLGVLLYELASGKLPFAQNMDNPYQIYAQVMRNKLYFPPYMKDESEKSIIGKLLSKNPVDRLQNGGLQKIKKESYFNGFNWSDLEQGKIIPPYIPKQFKSKNQKKYENLSGYPLLEHLKEANRQKVLPKIEEWTSNIIKL